MTKPANLRLEMPKTAEIIDELRKVFGVEAINAQIKAGMNGIDVFYASENGHEVGTRSRYSQDQLQESKP